MSKSYLIAEDEHPHVGYKMVKLPNGMVGIATLRIPTDANVIKTSYVVQYRGQPIDEKKEEHRLLRTDKALVTSISSIVGSPTLYIDGYSLRNPKFKYTVGVLIKDPLKRHDEQDGNGIHFFTSEKFAKMWQGLLGVHI